jgi:hypothetical protein
VVSRGSPPRPTRKLSPGKDLSAWALLTGVERTSIYRAKIDANDPKRSCAPELRGHEINNSTAARRRSLFPDEFQCRARLDASNRLDSIGQR